MAFVEENVLEPPMTCTMTVRRSEHQGNGRFTDDRNDLL